MVTVAAVTNGGVDLNTFLQYGILGAVFSLVVIGKGLHTTGELNALAARAEMAEKRADKAETDLAATMVTAERVYTALLKSTSAIEQVLAVETPQRAPTSRKRKES